MKKIVNSLLRCSSSESRRAATFVAAICSFTLMLSVVGELSAKPPAKSDNGRWVHRVNGGGIDSYPNANGNPTFEITFNARTDADGYTDGVVEWTALDGTVLSYGLVVDMEVRGNRAYMKYIALGGASAAYGTPGHAVYLGLEDNGEGKNALPDRQTPIFFHRHSAPNYTAAHFANFIENRFDFRVLWLHGNVQVR